MELQTLIKKREEHVQSCRENNDKSHEIIAGLYSDLSHFVYELLQNADDAEASEVAFELTLHSIRFSHNGRKLFNSDDIESITTVGSSAKKDDINAIGKFGAGFKSVFGVTSSPNIHSGEFHFKIVDFIVPQKIDAIDSNEKTIIILPFNRNELSSEKTYEQIVKRLKTLKAESLLFVRNIREIQWSTEEDNGHYLAKINKDKADIISRCNNEDSSASYLLFNKDIKINSKGLRLYVAYELDGSNIKSLHDTELFVFFPTNEKTGLNFIVHAPYKTTPSRESIPFDDEENKKLTNELSSLIADSIILIKERSCLNVDFLTMLPIEEDKKHPIYSASFEQVKNTMLNEDILPTSNGSFTKLTDAVLAREKELVALLDEKDCAELFGKANWLDSNITDSGKTGKLRDYLIGVLGIQEVVMATFCSKITEDFIKQKKDDWLIRFYSSITTNKALYKVGGVLRKKPIIRLDSGAHICPENDLGEQVYLPATERDSGFKTVKRSIAEDESAGKFLSELGLQKPDEVAEIRELISPKYRQKKAEVVKENYLEDFKKAFGIWSGVDKSKQDEIIDILKCVYFVGGVDSEDSFVTEKPEGVYKKTEGLGFWFSGNRDDRVVFLASELEDSKYEKFIEKLGVKSSLEIITEEDQKMVGTDARYKQRVGGFNPSLSIAGLDYSLSRINLGRSLILWKLLLRSDPDGLFGCTKTKGVLKNDFQTGGRENSEILCLLEGKHWLYGKSSSLINQSISNISVDDLHDDYIKEHVNINKLIEALGLKLDVSKQFEKENPGFVVMTEKDKEEFDRLKMEAEKKEEGTSHDSEWSQDVSPEEVYPAEDTTPIKNVESHDLSNQSSTDTMNDDEDADIKLNSENGSDRNLSRIRCAKEIGDWGERCAKKYLEEKYLGKSVDWLNTDGNIGRGYDFVIQEDGVDIAYFEVKSKVDESPQEFDVTGTQWNYARKLHSEGKGDMYHILLVKGAGTRDAKVKLYPDPVGLWKAGKIYATPVNIRF